MSYVDSGYNNHFDNSISSGGSELTGIDAEILLLERSCQYWKGTPRYNPCMKGKDPTLL